MPLFSLGYQGVAISRFDQIARSMDIVIDARSVPRSRIPGWSQSAVAGRLGEKYQWHGATLGGRLPRVATAGLRMLVDLQAKRRVLYFCACCAPGQCHRHNMIAVRLLDEFNVDTLHIHDDHAVLASELRRSIDEDTDYEADLLTAIGIV